MIRTRTLYIRVSKALYVQHHGRNEQNERFQRQDGWSNNDQGQHPERVIQLMCPALRATGFEKVLAVPPPPIPVVFGKPPQI